MRTLVSLMLGFALVLTVAPGCTRRMERRFDQATGRNQYSVNLNTASKQELAALPGLNDDDADRIIAHRPYNEVSGLLNKKVIGRNKFDQIRDMVYVRR
jgi:DNA uptake protein ComE-like DNA-binding protein